MPTNTNILMIRHAEKPDSGQSLSELGQQRAEAYVSYFQNFKIGGTNIKLDYLFAAANSFESHRPKLTLEPLAKALGLDINDKYKDRDYSELASKILEQSKYNQTNILISWHHQELLQFAEALGVNPNNLLAQSHWPSPPWPDDVFNWLLQLCYDASGNIIPFQTCCINERLLADDDNKNPLIE
ncbi:MAG: hypothetical protein JO235_00645 [Chroococcidiopsidaceae cyanobacterium CP_BM_RX_35]|nr:hypothetical protein [Chroococcidiopsidaceae cyanobacterium CP_BM_RX_35]